MTVTVTVAGSTKTVQAGSMTIAPVANGRDTMRATFRSFDGSYRPAVGAEIIVTQDGTRVFGGFIETPRESQIPGSLEGIDTVVHCVSFKSLADDLEVTEDVADGTTLKAFLQTLEATYFPDISVTLDAAQVTGPNLPAMSFYAQPLADVFNKLAEVTDYTWNIDAFKVAIMTAPASTAAPFNIAVGDGNMDGDLTVERSQKDYANRIVVRAGESLILEKTDNFTGNGVLTTFDLTYQMVYSPVVGRGYVIHNGVYETLGLTNAHWVYAPTTNTLIYTPAENNVAAAVPNTDTVQITYSVQFPITVQADDLAAQASDGRVRSRTYAYPNIYDKAQAQAVADNLLAQAQTTLETLTFSTRTAGLRPGMTMTVNIPARNVNGTYLVQETRITNDAGVNALRHEVTAVGGTVFRGSYWRALIKSWLGDDTAAAAPPSVGSGGFPSMPLKSVQSNESGAFYGSKYFLADAPRTGATYGVGPDQHTVAIGVASGTAGILALFNETAGNTKALCFTQANTGATTISKANSSQALTITNYDHDINLSAYSIGLQVNDKANDYIRLVGLSQSVGLMPAVRRITSSYTVDSTIGGGGMPDFAIMASGTLTVTLPALTSSTVLSGTIYRRCLFVRNIGTGIVTIDADSSETINGDLTVVLHPGQSTVLQALTGTDAGWYSIGSHALALQSKTVTLTDAQIKALPTTAITLVSAPASGYRIRVVSGSLHLNNSAGAYTNVTAATGNLTVQTADGNWLLSPIANQTSFATPLTRLTDYLTTAASTLVDLPPYLEAVQAATEGDWGWEQPVVSYTVPGSPQAVVLGMSNAAGNLTGGNSANTLKATIYYVVESL